MKRQTETETERQRQSWGCRPVYQAQLTLSSVSGNREIKRYTETVTKLGPWTSISSSYKIIYSIRLERDEEIDRDEIVRDKAGAVDQYIKLSNIIYSIRLKRDKDIDRDRKTETKLGLWTSMSSSSETKRQTGIETDRQSPRQGYDTVFQILLELSLVSGQKEIENRDKGNGYKERLRMKTERKQ